MVAGWGVRGGVFRVARKGNETERVFQILKKGTTNPVSGEKNQDTMGLHLEKVRGYRFGRLLRGKVDRAARGEDQ